MSSTAKPAELSVDEQVRNIVANQAIEGLVLTKEEIEGVRQHVIQREAERKGPDASIPGTPTQRP